MAEAASAEARLNRILQLLPYATREDGVALSELAARLGVPEREVLRDLQEVIGRSYYRPAGDFDDVTVMIEAGRVEVWTSGHFRRPMRLTPHESMALGLGLRMLAAMAEGAPGELPGNEGTSASLRALAASLELRLAGALGEGARRGGASSDGGAAADLRDRFAIGAGLRAPGAVHATLSAAARERRRCRIRYLSSGSTEPAWREVDPYALLVGSGRWYLAGFCHARGGIRVFRLDRVLEAERLEDPFERSADFDPRDYIDEGRVYKADAFEEVLVRYSARIARWIEEQGPAERLPDGRVEVRYAVADRSWVVRHVLEHAPEAEVVWPEELREEVRSAAARSQ